MKVARPRPRKNHPVAQSRSAGVPVGFAVLAVACCSGGAWFLGERSGYARASAEVAVQSVGDPLERLDAMEEERKARSARSARRERAARTEKKAAAPAPAAAPQRLSFHDSLKGGPSKPIDLVAAQPTFVSTVPPRAVEKPKPAPRPAPEQTTVAVEEPKAVEPAPEPEPAPAEPVPIEPVAAGEETPAPPVEPAVVPAPVEKPAEPRTPAPPQLHAAPATSDLTLQAGAYPDKVEALKLFERLKTAGLRPTISPSEVDGTTWYRVRVGRFADRGTAEEAARALQESAQLTAVVVKP